MYKADELSPKERVEQDILLRRLKKSKKEEMTKYDAALDIADERQARIDLYEKLDKKVKPHAIKQKISKHDSESTALLVMADIHCDERVDPDTINGVNEYTPEICSRRMDTCFKNATHMINIQRASVSIPQMKLISLGDNISGFIRTEDYMKNSMKYDESMEFLLDHYVSGIDHLLKYSGCEGIEFIGCFGNHGRLTDKVYPSSSSHNSMETVFYHTLERVYRERKEKRISFVVATGYHTFFEMYGKRYRVHHGDYFRYGGGIGGITIPANKIIAKWNEKIEAPAMDFFGHFHQMVDGGHFICCPSMIGYNAYAKKIGAAYDEPKQLLVLINNERGKTITAPIFVEEKK